MRWEEELYAFYLLSKSKQKVSLIMTLGIHQQFYSTYFEQKNRSRTKNNDGWGMTGDCFH